MAVGSGRQDLRFLILGPADRVEIGSGGQRVFEPVLGDQPPKSAIERRAERDVGGLVEQLDADRVERPRPAIAEERKDHLRAALDRDLFQSPMREAIELAPFWSRAARGIAGRADQVHIPADAAAVDSHAPDEAIRWRRRREEV